MITSSNEDSKKDIMKGKKTLSPCYNYIKVEFSKNVDCHLLLFNVGMASSKVKGSFLRVPFH